MVYLLQNGCFAARLLFYKYDIVVSLGFLDTYIGRIHSVNRVLSTAMVDSGGGGGAHMSIL